VASLLGAEVGAGAQAAGAGDDAEALFAGFQDMARHARATRCVVSHASGGPEIVKVFAAAPAVTVDRPVTPRTKCEQRPRTDRICR
jgi:hypothetical protein